MSTASPTPPFVDEDLLQFLYSAPVAIIQLAADGTIEMCNPRSAQMLMPLIGPDGFDNLFDRLARWLPDLRPMVEVFAPERGLIVDALRFAPGLPEAGVTYALHVTRLNPQRLMVVMRDATSDVVREKDEIARQLHRSDRIDRVTALPNRIAVRELIDATALAGRPNRSALLLIGSDQLQHFDRTTGESARRQVVRIVSERLTGALRPTDCIECRGGVDQIAASIGNGEYVVYLQRLTGDDDATNIAERLLDVLTMPYLVDGESRYFAFSIGMLQLGEVAVPSEEALRDATHALIEAKGLRGSRCVTFEAGMRDRAARRAGLENELRHALEHDELFVVFQPVVDLQDGPVRALCGVEALVRWHHPTRGVVSPIEFIGIAEESGLIDALGRQVVEKACRSFADLVREFGDAAPRTLAVNLSRAQLDDPTLIAHVREVTHRHGIEPSRIQLEVTESWAAQNESVRAKLDALKALGPSLALDDFGTGYSSLSSLHQLPVDTLKIDRSFVTLLGSSPHHRVLVEATIRVARSLGMTTVAEGIETVEQAEIVASLGCDKGQGYLFGRPLDLAAMRGWIRSQGARRFLRGPLAA